MSDVPSKIQRLQSLPRIASITACDYTSARLADEAGIDLILVGDSLGMVFAGFENTTFVTLDHMVYHTEIAARAVRRAFLVSDLPYQTYETPSQALATARRLVAAGAEGVKLEGGEPVLPQIRAILAAGIPLVGHLGMLPQSILAEKRYRKKGTTEAQAAQLLRDARLLEEAGACAIVLESVVPAVAESIASSLRIPAIGIGCGHPCRGEIAVFHDVVGAFPWFRPPFAIPRADVASEIARALAEYAGQVREPPVTPPR